MAIVLFPEFSVLITKNNAISQAHRAVIGSMSVKTHRLNIDKKYLSLRNLLGKDLPGDLLHDNVVVSSYRFYYTPEFWDDYCKAEHLYVFLVRSVMLKTLQEWSFSPCILRV